MKMDSSTWTHAVGRCLLFQHATSTVIEGGRTTNTRDPNHIVLDGLPISQDENGQSSCKQFSTATEELLAQRRHTLQSPSMQV